MGMKPRRRRCLCCERLMPPSKLIVVYKLPWGSVEVCEDAVACGAATPDSRPHLA